MPAEATTAQLVASSQSPAALLGRSLGRSVRLATQWVSAVTGSAESAIARTLQLRPTGPRAVPAVLLEELAALIRAQPDGQVAALAKNAKLWSLVEELYAVRHLGAPGDGSESSSTDTPVDGPTQGAADVKVVDASVLPAGETAVPQEKPQPARGKAARAAAAQSAAAEAGDGPEASVEPKPKDE